MGSQMQSATIVVFLDVAVYGCTYTLSLPKIYKLSTLFFQTQIILTPHYGKGMVSI